MLAAAATGGDVVTENTATKVFETFLELILHAGERRMLPVLDLDPVGRNLPRR